jgi:chorismate mutase/prephenate dehydratase
MFRARANLEHPEPWAPGEFLSFADVGLSPASAVLSYGVGAFEGLKARRRRDGTIVVFRAADHGARLQRSAERLHMARFPVEAFVAGVKELVGRNARFVPPHGRGSFYVRPVQHAVEPMLGLGPCRQFQVLMYGSPVGAFFAKDSRTEGGLRLEVAEQARCAVGGTGAVKVVGNYAGGIAVRERARANGFDDVLYLDAGELRFVTETSGANVFVVTDDGRLVTPPLDDQVLPGVTRDSCIRIAQELLGIDVQERPIALDEVMTARELFCTGTAWVVRSVEEVVHGDRSHRFSEPDVGKRIREELQAIQRGDGPDRFGWLDVVEPDSYPSSPARRASSGSNGSGRPHHADEAVPPHTIDGLRRRINSLDDELIQLIAERRSLSQEVVRIKDPAGTPVRDVDREQELLARLIKTGRAHGLDAHFTTTLFHEIIDDSVRLQQRFLQRSAERAEDRLLRIAFQGTEGAYSHLAAQKYFAERADHLVFKGFRTFEDVVRAVEKGDADRAFLPIENTTLGAIHEVYDLFLDTRLSIVGEEQLRIEHCLVSVQDVPLASIRRIYSQPQAVAQCSSFLAGMTGCEVRSYVDTAGAAVKVKEDGDPSQAAIASEQAARSLGMAILRRDIANQKDNFTRFIVAAREPQRVDLRIPSKTSLVMATGQKAGSLVEALIVFRDHDLPMTKLQSRPFPGKPWNEMFYVDFRGNLADDRVKEALDELARVTSFIKVLGSYPDRNVARTSPPPAVFTGEAETAAAPALTAAPPVAAPVAKPSTAKHPYRLASREHKPEDTVIEVQGVRIGGPDLVVIAGPCAVESPEQVFTCAREVKERGAQILRGGCFKPRTSPYSFQGLGFEGLDYLVEAGRRYGLPVVTEVLSPADVEAVAERSDILQIGARNMQNFSLLREVGRVPRPIMLKRGLMASVNELLQAAEYVLAQGNLQVFLCERGIRTFETATRNTLDLSAIPVLRQRTHLPIIVDPSHAAGNRDLVPPLAIAAKAIGSQGLMVEIHPDPESALSDGPQALRFPQFARLMTELATGVGRPA